MALKPQLYGANGTLQASQFIEYNGAAFGPVGEIDHIAASSSGSQTTRVVSIAHNTGDSLDIYATGNTLGTSNFPTITTNPIYTVTERDRLEDTTHSRSLQRFTVDNLDATQNNGVVAITATWGTASTKVGLHVRLIGNTSGALNTHANNWQTNPGTGVGGVTTGFCLTLEPRITKNVFLTAYFHDSASNNQDVIAGIGNGWAISDGTAVAGSTLCARISSKTVTTSNSDQATLTATVDEDHLSIMGAFGERIFTPMRIFGNNSIQVGEIVEKAGWARPQICSNGTYITTQFVEG